MIAGYWLCCGSTNPKHGDKVCHEARAGYPERVRWIALDNEITRCNNGPHVKPEETIMVKQYRFVWSQHLHWHDQGTGPLSMATPESRPDLVWRDKPVKPEKSIITEQYYYRNPDCPADNRDHPNCICWHDQGTGPVPSASRASATTLTWRDKPVKPIRMGKQYRTRDGKPVRILCTDGPIENYPVVAIADGIVCLYRIDGSGHGAYFDLIEVAPYDNFKIDDPVMVRSKTNPAWKRRYFAGVSPDGMAMVWQDGATRWSSKGKRAAYPECRRPTADELQS